MPFITEEIWQHLPHEGMSIMTAAWPCEQPELVDETAEQNMAIIMEIIKAIRNMRSEVNVPPGKKSEVILLVANDAVLLTLQNNRQYVTTLAAAEPVNLSLTSVDKPQNAMTQVVGGVEIYLPLKSLIDVGKETARLSKELETIDKELERIAGKLTNAGFIAKAPSAVIAKEQARVAEYEEKKILISERLAYLAEL
jgi:valyl-tRNA synthetase